MTSIETTEILQSLRKIARAAHAIDVREYESKTNEQVSQSLGASLLSLGAETQMVLKQVLAVFEVSREIVPEEGEEYHFYHSVDNLVSRNDAPREAVADLAFLTIGEISQRFNSLNEALREGEKWEIIARGGGCLGVIAKALSSVEKKICEFEGIPPHLNFTSEIQLSLDVRKTYRRFFYAVTSPQLPNRVNIYQYLHRAEAAIATLIGCDVYPRLRASDRFQFRTMQKRLLNFFQQGKEGDPVEGIHIWQDLAAFAELLMEVNNRSELLEYDRSLIGLICERLYLKGSTFAKIPEAFSMEMKNLFGRNLELDALILDPAAVYPEQWRKILMLLYEAMNVPSPKPTERRTTRTFEFNWNDVSKSA